MSMRSTVESVTESTTETKPRKQSVNPLHSPLIVSGVVALLLAFFVGLLYYPLLFTNRVLAGGDIQLYFYPYRDYAAAALREGRIPLWNPYIFNGVPFLANPQAAVLYPLHWPLSWLPVTKQIYWSAALHTWLLGFGGYLLARRFALGTWASLTTALILAGSGFYGGLIGHINQMNGAAWLPWGLLVLQQMARERQSSKRTQAERKPAGRKASASAGSTSSVLDTWMPPLPIYHSILKNGTHFALVVALMILAGHTQTAYINLFGMGIWLVWQGVWQLPDWQLSMANLRRLGTAVTPVLLVYAIGVGLAILLSAAQLLPTLELSALGLRSGGLSYGDVSSFSLRPTRLPWTLLPTYGLLELGPIFGAGYTEFVGYVGLLGFLLAAVGAWRGRGMVRSMGLFFAALGLFLALGRWNPAYYLLYKLVPGFDLFRVPARWMMLYTLGMALLAGVGMEHVTQVPVGRMLRTSSHLFRYRLSLTYGSLVPAALVAILIVDLLAAAQALPHAHPTAPQAVYGVRTAPAHLLTDPVRATLDPAAMGRFLGMSTITFDPGDMADWQRVLRDSEPPQLDEAAFYDFVIGLKVQELLVPNLPLFWRVPAVDGFDGGVLPLQRYNKFLTLFVPSDRLVPDGRLREQVKIVPDANLLGLFNAQYVITDKVRDLWFDNVYYDRQIGAQLAMATPAITIEVPQPFAATHLDLIGYIDTDSSSLHEEQVIATVAVAADDGSVTQLALTAGSATGAHFAGPRLDDAMAEQSGATIAFRDIEQERQEYRARLRLPQLIVPTAITITQATDAPPVVIQAATLYDLRTQMFTPLLPSDRGHFRLVHSGDVKIYENVDVRPRAYLVHNVLAVADIDAALTALRGNPAIRAGQTAVVEANEAAVDAVDNDASFLRSTAHPTDSATIVAYDPEQVTIAVTTTEAALLVLSDTAFPGWQATVDGEPTPIHTTNVLFRGVEVPPGEHRIVMRYQPTRWRSGVWLTLFGSILWLGLLLLGSTHKFAKQK